MSCRNKNSSWSDLLDSEIVYTGLGSECELLSIEPGMKLRDVINLLALSICELSQGEQPIPLQIIEDSELSIDTTSSFLNQKYPQMAIGGIVYNQGESVQFTKYPTGWKFEIIEIR